MINRREILATTLAAALLAPSSPHAQTPGKVYRLAVIAPAAFSANAIRTIVFPELARNGFVEGRNLSITMHVGPLADLPALARTALDTKPDVVIASTNAAVNAVLALSKTIPIVMAFAGEDPVAAGLARSLGRPGGSVTGLTNMATQLDGKRVSLLKEAAPAARRLAILAIPPPRHIASIEEMQKVAGILGLAVEVFYADKPADYAAAFAAMRAARCDALAFASAPEYIDDAALLAQLAVDAGLPTIGEVGKSVRDGILMGYGPNFAEFRKRAADHVTKILRGTAPGDIPIEQPMTFEFAVNLKTAKALGIELPPTTMVQALEVIE